eukprot:6949053-Prymnesium_polylepis.1
MKPMSMPVEPPTSPRARSSELTSIATVREQAKRPRVTSAHGPSPSADAGRPMQTSEKALRVGCINNGK